MRWSWGVALGLLACAPGEDGLSGIDCWDLNGDRVDDEEEDVNEDGEWSALDCQGVAEDGDASDAGAPSLWWVDAEGAPVAPAFELGAIEPGVYVDADARVWDLDAETGDVGPREVSFLQFAETDCAGTAYFRDHNHSNGGLNPNWVYEDGDGDVLMWSGSLTIADVEMSSRRFFDGTCENITPYTIPAYPRSETVVDPPPATPDAVVPPFHIEYI